MLTDISIVVWKEWKELLQFQSGKRSSLTGLIIMVLIFGIFMPIQWGSIWLETAAPLSFSVIIPLLFVGTMIADSIAGERERHTLETLLASRLPDGMREVVSLRAGSGMSYGEIAELLGIPEGTARSRMYNAVRILQTRLGISRRQKRKEK